MRKAVQGHCILAIIGFCGEDPVESAQLDISFRHAKKLSPRFSTKRQ